MTAIARQFQNLRILTKTEQMESLLGFETRRRCEVLLKRSPNDSAMSKLLQAEFQFCSEQNIPHLLSPLDQYHEHGLHNFVYSCPDVVSLDELCRNERSYNITQKLDIAIGMARALQSLHQSQWSLQAMLPETILVERQSQRIVFTDASHCKPYDAVGHSGHTGLDERYAPFMAPEQSGRIGRGCDYRVDLYYFGMIYYKLFSGEPAFSCSSWNDYIYHHLSSKPLAVDSKRPELPGELAQMIARLIDKDPARRYQSAWGLLYDLQYLHNALEQGLSLKKFKIASHDVSDKLILPSDFFGRSTQKNQFINRLSHTRLNQFIVLHGPAGIGKSTLLEHSKPMLATEDLVWIQANFVEADNFRPYEAIVKAFTVLVKDILGRSDRELTYWKARIRKAVGDNGQIALSLIPELELIIGNARTMKELGPKEEQSRFELTIRSLLRSFLDNRRRMVIVLDNGQWIDLRSFELLAGFSYLESTELSIVMLYRQGVEHPRMSLEEVGSRARQLLNFHFESIAVEPYAADDIAELLHRALSIPREQLDGIANEILHKTHGNPLVVDEFLREQYEKGGIYFDSDRLEWRLNEDSIRQGRVSDDIAAMLGAQILSMPPDTVRLLGAAACFGMQFSLQELQECLQLEAQSMRSELLQLLALRFLLADDQQSVEAMRQSLTVDLTGCFRFAHNRIRQAALTVLSQEELNTFHTRIGTNKLARLDSAGRGDEILDIVDHLSYQAPPAELRVRYAALNLQAARKARMLSAFNLANECLERAHHYLKDEHGWQNHYELNLNIFHEQALIALLERKEQRLQDAVEEILVHARSVVDTVRAWEIKIQNTLITDKLEAIRITHPILQRLNFNIPKDPSKFDVLRYLFRTFLAIAPHKDFVAVLAEKTGAEDPVYEAGIRIGTKVGSAAYLAMPNLTPVLLCIAIQRGLKIGHVSTSAFAYASFGIILTGIFEKFKTAERLGALSRQLAKHYRLKDQECRVEHMINSFIRPWVEPLDRSLSGLLQTFTIGLESGEFEFACHAINIYSFYCFYAGKKLIKLEKDLAHYRSLLEDLNQDHLKLHTEMYRQGAKNLIGDEHEVLLKGQVFDEALHQEFMANTKDFAHYYALLKLCLAIYYHDLDAAIKYSRLTSRYADAALGSFASSVYLFFNAILCARIDAKGLKVKGFRKARRQIQKACAKFKVWSRHCSENFEHRWQALQAELDCLDGHYARGFDGFQKAIAMALKSGFINEEALITERYAENLMDFGVMDAGLLLMQRSVERYHAWGADQKVMRLCATYNLELSDTRSVVDQKLQHDLIFLRQAISKMVNETVDETLLVQTLRVCVEYAGAESGHLLLRDRNASDFYCVARTGLETYSGLRVHLQDCQEDLCITLANYVARSRRSLVVADAQLPNQNVPGLERDSYVKETMVRSMACLPIMLSNTDQSNLLGLLYLENRQTAGLVTDEKLAMLETIVQTAAGRLELSQKNHSLEHALSETELVQKALLPAKLQTKNFTVSEYYQSAEHAGGDWYGFFEDMDNGRLYFFLGDVTGHGVSSSLVTGTAAGSAYSCLDTLRLSENQPDLETTICMIAEVVNRAVFHTGAKVDKLMTMVFVVVDVNTGEGAFINAGHPSGVLINQRRNKILIASGSPLGMRETCQYKVGRFMMQAGDSLFFYTDGLLENRGGDGRSLKRRRLVDVLTAKLSPEENKQNILSMVRKQWGQEKPEDDCAFIIMKRRRDS